nr:hypothetical protein [Tanacetum cinerariifolium]
MIPNGDEASTSHNVFNERLKDAYFDASTSFHDSSNVHTDYQPYLHKKKWTKDYPLHKIIEESAEARSPGFIVYGYDELPMQPVAPHSPDYAPGPEHPLSPDYVPGPEHLPLTVKIPYVPEP